ncbi:MAG: hypothetical protein ACXW37_11395 [Nitrospira sp.]|nr:hypothetical protein [Blastocatellia bacterium]
MNGPIMIDKEHEKETRLERARLALLDTLNSLRDATFLAKKLTPSKQRLKMN